MKEIEVRTIVGQIHEELEKLSTLSTQKNCKIDMGLDNLAYASLEYIKQLKEELSACMIERNKFLDIIEKAINKLGRYADEMSNNGNAYAICVDLLDILQKYKGDSNE